MNRRLYVKTMVLPAVGLLLAGPMTGEALASSKATKASAGYVDHPAGSSKCSNCANYVKAGSMCQVVAGKVSPNGFCNFFSPAT
ncbi:MULTISPECIES: hypothetical protein [Acidiphilium]|nr:MULTISPECIES: hypothetical protein [Acidiphilium]